MHFCVFAARVYDRFSSPRKIGLNWFIPALVNSSVGSSCGTTGELGTNVWPCFCTKKSMKAWRICAEVGDVIVFRLYSKRAAHYAQAFKRIKAPFHHHSMQPRRREGREGRREGSMLFYALPSRLASRSSRLRGSFFSHSLCLCGDIGILRCHGRQRTRGESGA